MAVVSMVLWVIVAATNVVANVVAAAANVVANVVANIVAAVEQSRRRNGSNRLRVPWTLRCHACVH